MSNTQQENTTVQRDSEGPPETLRRQPPEVVAAIPCYNEELFIGSVVLKTLDYVDRVIVIDDGSTDKTASVAEKAGANVVKHASNKGKGAAVSSAFEYAKKVGCKALVLLDGDGQQFCDREADNAMFDAIKANLKKDIAVVEMNNNINDAEFSAKAVEMMLELIAKARKSK